MLLAFGTDTLTLADRSFKLVVELLPVLQSLSQSVQVVFLRLIHDQVGIPY